MDGLNIGGKALKLKTNKEKLKKRPLSNILPLNLYYIDIYSIQRWKKQTKDFLFDLLWNVRFSHTFMCNILQKDYSLT